MAKIPFLSKKQILAKYTQFSHFRNPNLRASLAIINEQLAIDASGGAPLPVRADKVGS
jgi:hypothetical protein